MQFTTVNLTIKAGAIYNATIANHITSPNVQNLIALFDGKTVECRAYGLSLGVINVCFSVTERMIRDAWENYEKDNFRLNDKVIDGLVEHFVQSNLSCCLPALNIENIDELVDYSKKVKM